MVFQKNYVIESESAINAGTSFLMFTIFQSLSSSQDYISFYSIFIQFIQLTFGGIGFGILAGMVTYYSLSNIYSDYELEIVLTLCMVYLFAFAGMLIYIRYNNIHIKYYIICT